jgi:hypothetical protein
MSATHVDDRPPSNGIAEILKHAAITASRWRPSAHFSEVTNEILRAPFAFGLHQLHRPGSVARAYAIDAGVIFLAATVLAWIAALVWPNSTLALAQAVVVGLGVVALLVGNGVALVLTRFSGRPAETGSLVIAALYGIGFSLLWVAAFKLVGLIGPALVPGYSGSAFEALTVLGGMGGVLFGALLLLEWPRRIAALEEGAYYTAVAGLFLILGIVLKLSGIA